MQTELTPLRALRQYMALMGSGGLLVARVGKGVDLHTEERRWVVRPYWVEVEYHALWLRPLGLSLGLYYLSEDGGNELLQKRGWTKEPRPGRERAQEAWEDAQRLRYCAIPLSGQGGNQMAELTDQEAFEILQDLSRRLITMTTSITPIRVLHRYLELMGGGYTLVARVRASINDERTRVGWRVMPYWLHPELHYPAIELRPLVRDNRDSVERRGWYWKQPWYEAFEDAWAHAQRMRDIAIPLSGEGAPDTAYLTEEEALEILRNLSQHLADILVRLDSWESADAVKRIGEL